MVLEWTVNYSVEFPEEKIECILEKLGRKYTNDYVISDLVTDMACCFDDEIYYAWGEEQTKKVTDEIKRRLGGVQLSMFDNEN